MRKKKIIITTTAYPKSGYYEYHYFMSRLLQQLGWQTLFVYSSPHEFIQHFPFLDHDTVLIVATTGEHYPTYINHYGCNRIIFSTFYEMFERVILWGSLYEENLLIITPTEWSAICLKKTYINSDINIVPLPYNVKGFQNYKKPKRNVTRFYYVGTNTFRKNLSTVLKTFMRYFAFRKDVEFYIHSINQSLRAQSIRKMVNNYRFALGYLNFQFRNTYPIKLNFTKLSSINKVHMNGDILISLSRGEGYHLPSVEALAWNNFPITANLGFMWYKIADIEDFGDYSIAFYKEKPVGIIIKCSRMIFIDSDDVYVSGFGRTGDFETEAIFKAYQEAFYLHKYNDNKNYYIDLNNYLLCEFEKQFKQVLKKYEERL